MIQFNKQMLLDDDVVVNCKTEEEANNFLAWSNSFCVDKSIHTLFDIYGEAACYEVVSPVNICIQKADYYRAAGRKIISYEDALLKAPKSA